MKITVKLFFDYYITHPLSKDLPSKEKAMALLASACLAPVTIGIFHIRSWILNIKKVKKLETRKIFKSHQEWVVSASKSKIIYDQILPTHMIPKTISLQKIPGLIKENFQPLYAQNLPSKEEVVVPVVNGKEVTWRKWSSLTLQEKIQVNNAETHLHNQISADASENEVDRWFFAGGPHVFIPGDPRTFHGIDHMCRAALFSGVFGYLYNKYHPSHNLNDDQIALCMLLGGGHDVGRQTDGPDVYDRKSAEITVNTLKTLGMQEGPLLKDCEKAIVRKDSPKLAKKSIYGKCIQNADSADFARLLLTSPIQSSSGFENSRNFLDIFRELKDLAQDLSSNDPDQAVLKNGLTFAQFKSELDSLREEMNILIYNTHTKEFRSNAVQSNSYFELIFNMANSKNSPFLSNALSQIFHFQ